MCAVAAEFREMPLITLSTLECGVRGNEEFDAADVELKEVESRSASALEAPNCVDARGG